MYDVVVAGGSIAGLLCAREIASAGFDVLVIEEDYEVGTPEHCGGLVSSAGLEELGIIPFRRVLGHAITTAKFTAPNGRSFTVDSGRQNVLEISRRELDKQVALQARRSGAEIRVRTSLQEVTEAGVRTKEEEIGCRILVDARGISSAIHRDKTGVLASAQYEVYADWIRKGEVQVFFDQMRFPGFFSWVIPSENGRGKIGVAGRGINAGRVLDDLVSEKGGCSSTVRKIFAPIWVRGPIGNFVEGNTVIVGDAAGQAKPTTAGGIFTGGMGGILAGRAVSGFLATGQRDKLARYQKEWTGRFGDEFQRQVLARNMLEGLDNKTINKLFEAVTPKVISEISGSDGFDFHAVSIARLLGARGTAKAVGAIAGSRFRSGIREMQGRYK